MILAVDMARWTGAIGLVLMYTLMCSAIALGQRRKRGLAAGVSANSSAGQGAARDWLIVYASQTGSAEELAAQSAGMLQLAGISTRVCELSMLTAEQLGSATRALFLVSTYGEGDAPDNAARFVSTVMNRELALPALHFGVLALGDRSYQHFCGFGASLHDWLVRQGAAPLFERIDVDRSDVEAIGQWRAQLLHQAGTSDAPDWDAPGFSAWTLAARRLLNPGSVGEPVFHLELAPPDGVLPHWESGDLVQVLAPGDTGRAREYSIASIPGDGAIHLLVRQQKRADGSLGVASGWLGSMAAVGDKVDLRLRTHKRFQLNGNADRSLILIGNGTGIAGLRAHLKQRILQGQGRNWLLFGERHAACDFHYRDEIEQWQAAGLLLADFAFSRDEGGPRHVQHCLLARADSLSAWVEEGAAIYVCGSLQGMAAGVDAALAEVLGASRLEQLTLTGRYRRDVY